MAKTHSQRLYAEIDALAEKHGRMRARDFITMLEAYASCMRRSLRKWQKLSKAQ